MSFLQPFLLAAIPLAALPVLIHLINQQRHRTVEWGAMRFLLDAKRMSRGMARIRHFLILLMRILAISALIFAISRPLASGWLGVATGGSPDTAIVILDRSASMEQQNLQTGESKRSTALRKVAELLEHVGKTTRIVLIESTENRAQDVNSASALVDLPGTTATATSADVPAMLQTAMDYVKTNQTGRTDIWICSDLRSNDWDAEGGRWQTIRDGFAELQAVRFNLLSYAQPAKDNLAVTVDRVHRRQIGKNAELILDVLVQRESDSEGPQTVPLVFVVNGVRSVVDIELKENEFSLQGHSIPLDSQVTRGWGRVELPGDANPEDNQFYFVFAEPAERRTVVVSSDARSIKPLRLAVEAPVDPTMDYNVDVLSPERASEIDWEAAAFLVWQAPLPEGLIAKQLQNFVLDAGKTVLFLPPDAPTEQPMFGIAWGEWQRVDAKSTGEKVGWWRGDADLLSGTQSGTPLPLDELVTYRHCTLVGDTTPLARFDNGDLLMARVPTDRGAVYFCSTLPRASHSSLARDGVVFYVMLQRALAQGAARMGSAQQVDSRIDAIDTNITWKPMDDRQEEILLSERGLQSAAYQTDDRLVAINRPSEEDMAAVVDLEAADALFEGLDYQRIDDEVDNATSLASEIWRAFLVVMALALILEAVLCLQPKKTPQAHSPLGESVAAMGSTA